MALQEESNALTRPALRERLSRMLPYPNSHAAPWVSSANDGNYSAGGRILLSPMRGHLSLQLAAPVAWTPLR